MANFHFESPTSSRPGSSDRSTLSEEVFDTLKHEIVTGAIGPGTRLVRRALSDRLGVSPVPVAEALLRLEMDGLVESRPLYGCRVPRLTMEDVENDAAMREAIECYTARACAERASDADLRTLLSKAQVVDRLMAQGDPKSHLGLRAHMAFHMRIARGSGFARMACELERVWFRRLMRLAWVKATYYKPVPRSWHQQLVEAILTRDPEAAEAKMREHVRFGREDDEAALHYVLDQAAGGTEGKPSAAADAPRGSG